MEMGLGSTLLPGDPRLIDHIVGEVKSQGIFDQFRKDALADVDTKPAYQNLRTRVEGSVNSFLSKQTWKADLNKNQLRETLRKHISDTAYLDAGVERIVDQVVNPKIYSVFLPQVEDVVYKYLGLEKPKREKNGGHSIKDLLPIDLDPVSPESDKNSLKDVSLDSIDDLELTNNENINIDQVDNADGAHTADFEKGVEEKQAVDIKEEVESEVNGTELIQSMIEEEKPTCSTSPLVDIGLNDSIKSEDKTEEEEEDSPVFEPIDIMNFHESNVSNDSHLSGISELTSHRSRSPDFHINEFSRDHFDFSNQDSQFSKVSSDSRLSIVTDFGSSNQASTPVPDTPKEEKSVEKNYDDKNKEKGNESKDTKNSKSSSSSSKERETARDKSDHKSKSSKERSDSRDSRSHRDRDYKKKSSTDSKSDRDKSRSSRDSSDKTKEKEKDKDSKDKVKDEKTNSSGKESKDLKDIYKEKIRELREKKELTEKEKLNKDKDGHRSRDSKDKKESKDSKDLTKESKDRRDSKEHRSSSSSSRSHRHESSSRSKKDDSKSSHDKKRDDRHSKDKSRNQGDSDGKRSSKDDKSEKDKDSKSSQKRKESKSDESRKSYDKVSTEKDKDKDKKRRDEKKSKSKDDHSSLHKSSNDRRSSDRDGSSGSNSKSSKNSCPGSSTSSSKPNSSLKETGNTSNSSSETSDGVDESQMEECRNIDSVQEAIQVDQEIGSSGVNAKRVDLGQSEISLPLKKRPLPAEGADDSVDEVKKPRVEQNLKEVAKNNEQAIKIVPDNERVQIIEVYEPQDDDDENEPYPDDAGINIKLEQSSSVIIEGENFFNINIVDNCKSNLTEMEMSIRESLNEMIVDKIIDTSSRDNKELDETAVEDEFENNTIEVNDCNNEVKKIVSDSEEEDCLYFIPDNARLLRFRQFLKSQNIDIYGEDENVITKDEGDNNDDIGDEDDEKGEQSVPNEENQESALAATMAPPQLKRKHSTSPLSDIVLNLDNNNDGHKDMDSVVGDIEKKKKNEKDKETGLGKKRLGRPKRQRPSVSSSSPNDDFVMPLSPESDVSATSDKISANHKDKDDKRLKSKQRYTSDDLYKPRPLFVGSSRRNRRSNPA